jgi:aminopeptidase-like protein
MTLVARSPRARDEARQESPAETPGDAMMALARELYPICRSITGDGMRQSLGIVATRIPLELREVPSATPVFDWVVPNEWNIRGAYIAKLDGTRVIDFAESNLHVVQYSRPVDRVVDADELQRHLHSLPEAPDWIPYRTGYYADDWGFCLAHRQRAALTDARYRVVIDSTLGPGSLSYGELLLPGVERGEVLLSCHSCHPSLANDNLSGMGVATYLARYLASLPVRRLSYRFLFIPGTIGSLTWLAGNEEIVPRVCAALVLTCLGDAGGFTYKKSRRGDASIDRYVEHVLKHTGKPYRVMPFIPYGYDERQYCSPGFDMPAGCFMRSPNGSFPEYHTSADDLSFISGERLGESLEVLKSVIEVLEHGERRYRSRNPKGEPQLGKRGLYAPIGGDKRVAGGLDQMALLWTLNLADGGHSLFETAARAGMPFPAIRRAAEALEAAALLEPLQ